MDKNNLNMDTIKTQFDQIKEVRLKIKQSIAKINDIKNSIKENYKQYITRETQYYFGLDSFHFQNKAIELEHANVLELYHFIDNRIYGDYYKLFSMIVNELKIHLQESQLDSVKEIKHLKNYPIYKDLEPFKKYDFDLINQIHQDIIVVLENSKEIYKENKTNIDQHKKQLDLGMNIDNYVINQEYMNHNLQMTNHLHQNYLNVFHKYHADWLRKYFEKIRLFHEQIRHHKTKHSIQKIKEDDDLLIINMSQPHSPESDKETNKEIETHELALPEEENKVIDNSLNSLENNDGFTLVTNKKKKRNRKKKH